MTGIGATKPCLIQRQVYLPDYVVSALEQEAFHRNMSFSQLCREILGLEAKRYLFGPDND